MEEEKNDEVVEETPEVEATEEETVDAPQGECEATEEGEDELVE